MKPITSSSPPPRKLQLPPPNNSQVAEYLTNIATAYEIKHKNRFRIVAYENAAETILTYSTSIYDMWSQDPKSLDTVPDIGPTILEKISYFLATGQPHPKIAAIFKTIHPCVFTFTKINGIGPILAFKLSQNSKFSKKPIKALDQLVHYAKVGKIRDFPGFGEKSEASILQNTLAFLGRTTRMPFADAQKLADKIIKFLSSKFPQLTFIPLGSLRRQSATVGDIDIAVASDKSADIIAYFLDFPDSLQTIAVGTNKASIRLLHDVRVDLMVKPKTSFGALLQHFTGSRLHNILLRRYALKLGFSLSEYGIREVNTGILHQFNNETDFYNFLGLRLIPPSERLGEDEISRYKML